MCCSARPPTGPACSGPINATRPAGCRAAPVPLRQPAGLAARPPIAGGARTMSPLNGNAVSPAADRTEAIGSARALNRRGILRFQHSDVPGALADFRQAALLEPNYAEPWNNSGLLRQTLGQLTEALADFERALAIRPGYPEA